MTPDFKRLLLLARLSQLIYQTDERKLKYGTEDLGLVYCGYSEFDECEGMLVYDKYGQIIVIRGTQVTENFSIRDLLDDLDPSHVNFGDDTLARAGAWKPLQAMWDNSLGGLFDPAMPVTITGHSLGGQRAAILPGLLPSPIKPKVVAFAPPKGGNEKFWKHAYSDREQPIIVWRENDFAISYDPLDMCICQPKTQLLHLTNGSFEWCDSAPWDNTSVSDHDIDKYVSDLERLAA